jgi:hypothetical protein
MARASVLRRGRGLLFLALLCSVPGRAAAPPAIDDVLRRTGRSVEEFWKQISAVNCVETVDQVKFGEKGKIAYRADSAFDYLIVLQLSGDNLVVDESRVSLKEPGPGKNVPLLITNGFSTFQFIFHPYYQGGFEYSDPEPVVADGRSLLLVRFRQVHGARSPSVLRVRKREYAVEWQGTAWIDPESGAIARIAAGLASSMEDIGLKSLNADVRYAPMKFQEDPGVHWLPATATIEAETLRQHWRNVHTFSKYRHFSVDTKTEVELPK